MSPIFCQYAAILQISQILTDWQQIDAILPISDHYFTTILPQLC
jgi:hypothetical protein